MLNNKVNQGFTLIEVMVVIVILSILAAFIAPRIIGHTDEARLVQVKNDMGVIENALKMYRLDNYVYPTTDQGLEALITKSMISPEPRQWREGGYLDRHSVPKDPWGFPYNYLSPGMHGEFDIYSLGADGQPDGTGINADIGNWQFK
ncbi:type II secretion system major pseudopilin GspG [Candidatus Parabeggiatoa sp. HSG14]|uniref:type II secretion system major pseudopilin GspG n=1 Tax=Candidatus Parabeggiatoa sp. HSG14 TaxID=3055593 RepID=UPI0025A78A0F|nr:type II secretion system major pseudopilin GspG [Thiotrichales bacterium HSG14]